MDHLRLEQDDTTVLLYHQASFLELHIESKWSALLFLKVVNFDEVRSSILQHDLIEETGRTLGLLIPFGDKKTKAWFQKQQRELGLDPKVGTYGPLNAAGRQIESFKYWRDRIIILKQIFDDVEPHTLRLWWYDDRKNVQWYVSDLSGLWIPLL